MQLQLQRQFLLFWKKTYWGIAETLPHEHLGLKITSVVKSEDFGVLISSLFLWARD